MCRPASLVVTKDRVFWSKHTESHESIIEEHRLYEMGVQGPNLVRVELVPVDNDFSKPVSEWELVTDQDILPDWWAPEHYEDEIRDVVEHEWLPEKVVLSDQRVGFVCDAHLVLIEGRVDAMSSTNVDTIQGKASIGQIKDSSSVTWVYGNTEIESVSNSEIFSVAGEASINAIRGKSLIEAIHGNASVDLIHGNTIVRMLDDSAKVGYVTGEAIIYGVRNKAQIGAISGSAIAKIFNKQDDMKIFDDAIAIVCGGMKKKILQAERRV